uniref:Uncharacterized protein n=1 Tax=Lactuca sativa TaxID=4236 RepID=A0A9R1X2W1_LACSA|nr:hypothetical protein LSAT_V11C700378850 [Lactuca sativa]
MEVKFLMNLLSLNIRGMSESHKHDYLKRLKMENKNRDSLFFLLILETSGVVAIRVSNFLEYVGKSSGLSSSLDFSWRLLVIGKVSSGRLFLLRPSVIPTTNHYSGGCHLITTFDH